MVTFAKIVLLAGIVIFVILAGIMGVTAFFLKLITSGNSGKS